FEVNPRAPLIFLPCRARSPIFGAQLSDVAETAILRSRVGFGWVVAYCGCRSFYLLYQIRTQCHQGTWVWRLQFLDMIIVGENHAAYGYTFRVTVLVFGPEQCVHSQLLRVLIIRSAGLKIPNRAPPVLNLQ